jgi:hypothetical protein
VPAGLGRWIEQLQLATRLREVRALAGFSRILPPRGVDGEGSNLVSLLDEEVDWLPAIEVKGEGLFIRLAEDHLGEWSARSVVTDRVAWLGEQDRRRHEEWGVAPKRAITPTLLLVHVLAHALINQLAARASVLRRRRPRPPDLHRDHRLGREPRGTHLARRGRTVRAPHPRRHRPVRMVLGRPGLHRERGERG